MIKTADNDVRMFQKVCGSPRLCELELDAGFSRSYMLCTLIACLYVEIWPLAIELVGPCV